MKKIIAILLAAVLLTAAFAGCSGKKPEDGKLKIITTIFPVYEWVSHVTAGTQNTDVSLLLNKGVDMHSFQPTTKDIVNISDCDVFVYVGGESDKWVKHAHAQPDGRLGRSRQGRRSGRGHAG